MADMIEGDSAFFVGKPAWHKKGVLMQFVKDGAEATRLAYPHTLISCNSAAELNGEYLPIKEVQHIIRSDGKYIGTVGDRYELVQPLAMGKTLDDLRDTNMVEFEAGGSLCEGKKMWFLLRIKNSETEIVKCDTVKAYILAATSFDGSMKHVLGDTCTRVVCNNTLQGALRGDSNTLVSMRHTASIHGKIEALKENIMARLVDWRKNVEAYRALAAKKMDKAQCVKYVEEVFDVADKKPEERSTRIQNTVRHVYELTQWQKSYELVPAARGTAWGAYNGVTQYLTHEYGNNDDSRLNAQWFGASAAMGKKALDLALAA